METSLVSEREMAKWQPSTLHGDSNANVIASASCSGLKARTPTAAAFPVATIRWCSPKLGFLETIGAPRCMATLVHGPAPGPLRPTPDEWPGCHRATRPKTVWGSVESGNRTHFFDHFEIIPS
jgi:hypothetical protein